MPQQPQDHPRDDADRLDGAGDHSLPVIEEPLDPANQALADALRLSFRLLKVVMVVLVVFFLGSGFFVVGPEEVGIVLRFGKIAGNKNTQVKKPGSHFAFPPPIDEQILIPTNYKSLEIDTFYFRVSDADAMKSLDEMVGRALEPGLDGAMLTGDKNIIHARWLVQYRIADPVLFVTNVYDAGGGNARERAIVRATLENALIAAVGRREVDDVIRGAGLDEALEEARADMQRQLTEVLAAGIEVNWIKYVKHPPTPPLQVRPAFNRVSQSENTKLREIETARTKANELLIGAAGENYALLIEKLDALEAAESKKSPEEIKKVEAELGAFFEANAGGEAINRINRARAFATRVEQEIKSDWEQFSRLLPEYRKNPSVVMRQQYWNVIPEILMKAKKWYVSRRAHLVIDMRPPPEWGREAARKRYGIDTEQTK